ncbi:DNA phosphorothioation-associated putative methyltransferase [Pseudaestuariivita rosea]|uniref:DNA phosphorothioation-associated putative methyltransferase n=1 Tax=Pseudaestuariivita rosea TaxID=2763263 RepID=UPI001ABABC75|nr:DNA phosphorothioation-associated putative methyltransferase [Pseudaestuariivita rosea]
MQNDKPLKNAVGKKVGQAIYVHRSAVDHLQTSAKDNLSLALQRVPEDFQWSVLKVSGRNDQTFSFLDYQDFSTVAFPELRASLLVNLSEQGAKLRKYSDANPPILHRKELLLAPDHPQRDEFAKLTQFLECKGLFKNMSNKGTRRIWMKTLAEAGLTVKGPHIVQIDLISEESAKKSAEDMNGPEKNTVERHKTAITRAALSAPMYLLFTGGLIRRDRTILDYGCGQGDDIRALQSDGYTVEGWDPHYRPDPSALKKSQITNLGFVLNVIEDPEERAEALRRAFSLTELCLAVSVMLYGKADLSGVRPYRDGYLTSRQTFQKYYTQAELRDFVGSVLNVEPIAVGQGIFLVFRDELEEQRYLLRRQIGFRGREHRAVPKPSAPQKPTPKESTGKLSKTIIQDLAAEIRAYGRQLDTSELPKSLMTRLSRSKQGLQYAASLAIADIGHEELEKIVAARTEELSLHFAMHAFSQRRSYSSFPPELRRDIRAFFGSHKKATEAGQSLLYSIGNQNLLLEDAVTAAAAGIGHLEQGRFQFPANRRQQLSVRLRGFVALAERLAGDLSEATLLKIHITSRKLTALSYADFETSFLPRLMNRVKVEFDTFNVSAIDHFTTNDVRLLYLKSRYMASDHPMRNAQIAFDRKVQALASLNFANEGPSFRDFAGALTKAGVKIPS